MECVVTTSCNPSPIRNWVLSIVFVAMLVAGGCASANRPAGPAGSRAHAEVKDIRTHPLANGAYLVLREAPTPQEAKANSDSGLVLVYDRRTYSGAPPDEPLVYVAIDPADFIPLLIEGAPEMQKDGRGLSKLTVSLARQNAKRAEDFTRSHLGARIAMVVDGEIVTLHKIRSVVTDGKLQITRCTDNACEVIRAKLTE